MNHFTISLSMLLVFFMSCTSEKDDQTPSVTQILTSAPWTSSIDYDDLDEDGNFVAFGDECDQDNRWIFFDTGKLNQDLGTVLCDPENDDPNTLFISDWELQDNDTYIVQKFALDLIKYKIISIEDNKLVLSIIDVQEPNADTHRVILTR